MFLYGKQELICFKCSVRTHRLDFDLLRQETFTYNIFVKRTFDLPSIILTVRGNRKIGEQKKPDSRKQLPSTYLFNASRAAIYSPLRAMRHARRLMETTIPVATCKPRSSVNRPMKTEEFLGPVVPYIITFRCTSKRCFSKRVVAVVSNK